MNELSKIILKMVKEGFQITIRPKNPIVFIPDPDASGELIIAVLKANDDKILANSKCITFQLIEQALFDIITYELLKLYEETSTEVKGGMNPPCKNCSDRHIGCHGSCERYLAYKTERDRLLAEQHRNSQVNLDIARTRDNFYKQRGRGK